jgi:hypothetical protein
MAVLNDCAAVNMKALDGTTPDHAAMQKAAAEAMQAATRQVSATIEETRKRLTMVQAEAEETLDSVGPSPPASAIAAPATKKARSKH